MNEGQIHEPYHVSDADAGLDHSQTKKPLASIQPANIADINRSLLHRFQFVQLVCPKNAEREETREGDARPFGVRGGSKLRL
jgi:hypothetical protein